MSALDLAREAANDIRYLNHATHPADGWPGIAYPCDADRTLASLSLLADRLQQTLRHLSACLNAALDRDHISIDGGAHADDPAAPVDAATTVLEGGATHAVERLARALACCAAGP